LRERCGLQGRGPQDWNPANLFLPRAAFGISTIDFNPDYLFA
jgi:hypothetical protein